MATFSRRAALPLAASLTVFAGAALAQLVVGDDDGPREKAVASDMKAAPVGVDRPKPTFMLSERDKRVHGLKPFQVLVDAAAPGATLRPAPGTYAGPVTIDKPLTIEGDGVTIDAGDRGTVMLVHAEGVTLRGLHLTGSGDSHDTDDSCLDVRGSRNVFENLVIDNCLFGIDLKQSNRNVLRGNRITSKPRDLGVRGFG